MASSTATAPSIHILAARPPTPPREASHDVDVSLRSVVLGRPQPLDPRRSLQTPPGTRSPLSVVATGSNPSSARVRKRVEWSSYTEYKDPPDYRDAARLDKPGLPSTPSSASPRPIKGILKPSPAHKLLASSLITQVHGSPGQPNLAEMLDSSIKQLAGPDRDSKLDAYMMLARALKTSKNLPDRVALQNKMSLFTQFIQRDITSNNNSGALDSSLVNHALTLLATFLHFPAIASTITSDFGLFIVDHAIQGFEDPIMPKDIVRHLMQVVAFQNFSPKVMAPERVGRLVDALHKIEDHVQGKSIVMSRLLIYKRLVKQARNCILAHADWLKDMFTDMLSTVRDIRVQAISLGTEAGFALRPDKLLIRKVADIFAATDIDEESYIDFYIKRLQRMVKDKQASCAVPQIWSVVILFLRCPFDRWEYYAPWLRLVQDAFNMTDAVTKQEANYAWNRYVCLSMLDSKMGPKAVNTLCKPLLSQLRRKTSPRHPEEAMKLRRIVLGGVCSLCYYAFAQGGDKMPTEVIWDVAIQPIITQLIELDGRPDVPGDCMMQAARILAGLLDVSTPRPPRSPNRIMDSTPLKPEELLPIDSKWVRRNCEKVFQAVEPIMTKKLVDLANKDSLVYRLWQALVGSVAAASAKDIKVSEDTARFLACSLSLLAKVWSKGCDVDDATAHAKFLPSVHHYVQVLVNGLDVLPFVEKKLPLHHLFSTLASIPPGFSDNGELANLFLAVFEPFFKPRNAKARSELARELTQLLPQTSLFPCGPWLLAAEHMRSCLDKNSAGCAVGAFGSEKLLGPRYRDLVVLLERGLASHPKLPADSWIALFELVSASICEGSGDAGCALVVEPLAKAILDSLPSSSALPSRTAARFMKVLFDTANLPCDRKALENARLRLWGAPPLATKAGSSDPFNNLYKLVNNQMQTLYNARPPDLLPEMSAVCESACMFLERCAAQAAVKTMLKMQCGLCPWIQDEDNHLQLPGCAPILHSLRRLWDRICTELTANERLQKKDLDQIEPLFVAALKSNEVSFVNKAAATWNSFVREDEKVECSENLRSTILSLRSKLDLVFPGASLLSSVDFDAQVSVTGDRDTESINVLSTTPHQDSQQVAVFASPASKPPSIRERQMEVTPEPARKVSKRPSTLRLRHEDSQIQFAVIAPPCSSPDDSQHLTDRQKEVRERQLRNAALYPDIGSDRPARQGHEISKASAPDDSTATGNRESLAKEATPTRNVSFDDMVRSTPTPRRQDLPVDDANDPPSSPPVPRPYPLLSEIQSRSRVDSSLDNWEFSSPTGSPVPKSHESHQNAGSTSPVANAKVSCTRRRTEARRRRSTKGEKTKAIPSSIPNEDASAAMSAVAKCSRVGSTAADPPVTPPRGKRMATRSKTWEKLKSVEDESVDARSSHDQRPTKAFETCSAEACGEEGTSTSFALSEGTAKAAVDLVIELESRRYDLSASEGDNSPGKAHGASNGDHEEDCILALPPSSRGPITRREARRLVSLAGASTPAGASDEEAEGGTRRKRKGGAVKQPETRGKRRRREEAKTVRRTHEPPRSGSTASRRQDKGAVTRRSSRRRASQTGASFVPEAEVAEEARPEEGGDTDGELLSQLVTESFAASQQSDRQMSAKKTTQRAANQEKLTSPDAVKVTAASPALAKARKGLASGDERPTILGTLRSGLEQLRQAALGREAVYELEDVLIDLKRELYDAEKRGRAGGQRGSLRMAHDGGP